MRSDGKTSLLQTLADFSCLPNEHEKKKCVQKFLQLNCTNNGHQMTSLHFKFNTRNCLPIHGCCFFFCLLQYHPKSWNGAQNIRSRTKLKPTMNDYVMPFYAHNLLEIQQSLISRSPKIGNECSYSWHRISVLRKCASNSNVSRCNHGRKDIDAMLPIVFDFK